MEPEGSLPFSQEPTTYVCPKSQQSRPIPEEPF
jgi:hypothetical protein